MNIEKTEHLAIDDVEQVQVFVDGEMVLNHGPSDDGEITRIEVFD
jgi:hypothetical protein